MEFRILGLLEALADGRVIDVHGAKRRALLAMLVLHVNQVVSAERLVEALWADGATASSPSSLRLHVSYLRRALGDEIVVTRSPGYVLVADPADIDARRFEQLATSGRRALDAGDAAGAVAAFDKGLALWRGSALADFPYEPFAQAEAARLEELRLVTTEDLAEAELALGRHGDLAGKLQALVEEHPLRERLWSSLMLALYRCGRQAEALRAYQIVRRVLADELAIEPGRALQRLEEAILLQRPELDLAATVLPGGAPAAATDRARAPLPLRLTSAAAPATFVGRHEQLGILAEAMTEAETEHCRRVVLISGEPGIGKTTVVSAFARRAHEHGAIVLYGRCDEGVGIAYQPWATLVAHLLEHPPSKAVVAVATDHGADLAHLGPEVARAIPGSGGGSSDPDTARHLLFGTVVHLLESASRDQPLVLILDDLHWADGPSLALLQHVVATHRPMSLLIVGTFRDTDLAANSVLADLVAGLRREAGVARLALPGLNAEELLEVVEAGIGPSAAGTGVALRDALARETNGNPFFAGELLRHVIEAEFVHRDADGQWIITGDLRTERLPAGVREVIVRRVARVGDDAMRVLSVAAVIGRDFDLGVVAGASDLADETVLEVLETAVGANLVVNVSGDQFSFVHALVQHALYDWLTPARRIRAHRRVADAIEAACGSDTGPRSAELAYHHTEAGSLGDPARAIAYAAAAGAQALAQLAPGEALRWYRQALDLLERQPLGDERRRGQLLVGLGDAQRQVGIADFRETLLDAARQAQRIDDAETLVAAVLTDHRGSLTRAGVLDVDRIAMIEAALTAVGPAESTTRARLLGLLGLERAYDGNYPARRVMTDEALRMARRLGDPATLLDVHLRRHQAIRNPDTLAERLADAAEAEALAARSDDPVVRFWAANNLLISAIESGDLVTFKRCRQQISEIAAAVNQPTLIWISMFSQGASEVMAGNAEAAEAVAAETLRLGTETGQPDVASVYTTQMVMIRWHQGCDAELVDLVAEKAENLPGLPAFRAGLARIYADSGLENKAADLLAAEAAASFSHPHDYLLLCYLCSWAEVAARMADRSAATSLYERLRPWSEQVVYIGLGVLGATDHYLGALATVLGLSEDAETYFERARVMHEQIEAPFHLARTHLEWGRALLAKTPCPDQTARSHLETARRLADQYGCRLVGHRAEELLRTLPSERSHRRSAGK